MRTLIRVFLFLGGLAVFIVVFLAFVYRDRRPQIYFAAARGDTNGIARYLASGGDVNAPVVWYVYGARRAPLLHIAAVSGQIDTVSFLLDHGADPNLRDSSGSTCLYDVVAVGDTEVELAIIEKLLKAGADPNLRSSRDGVTPLTYAIALRSTNVVRALTALPSSAAGNSSLDPKSKKMGN